MENPINKPLNQALGEIVHIILGETQISRSKLETLKREIAKKYQLNRFVRNSEILEFLTSSNELSEGDREFLIQFLQVRRVRTLSGIAVVAVMTKPSPCPGKCIYCPDVIGAPKSYTGREPAAMRGLQNQFDPKSQVVARLEQLSSIGHPIDKIHLVIMGGTFLANTKDYQEYFIKECLDGVTGQKSPNLNEAKIYAQASLNRNVGITFETRPDYCKEAHVNQILEYGGTWVEIGVQTLSESVLKRVQRHHSIDDVINAIRYSRDGGLKVTVHMMPNLFQTPNDDIRMFKTLFTNPKFVPDALKIYPTLVLPNTPLFNMWKNEEYQPYSSEEVIEVIAQIKAITPPFIRIQRVQRDIPAYLIINGINSGNLRELAKERLHAQNKTCKCIRCREIGHKINLKDNSWVQQDLNYYIESYPASEGIEHFISFETEDRMTIFGFLRLREPSSKLFHPILKEKPSTIIRELHVYGKLVKLGKLPKRFEWQHRGIGKKLIELAEEITRENGYSRIFVTSGLGVRDYYQKFGYVFRNPYMAKNIL
ncbi:tRNA uridine(34) 5-carboxymethylaminomethyl modification radical SAM/GNAT enzyme Elp3 [Candidatus Hodarchaeum mangrovi]